MRIISALKPAKIAYININFHGHYATQDTTTSTTQVNINLKNWLWAKTRTSGLWLDWIQQCFTSPATQYRLYGRWFLQVKRPNQHYQSTEGTQRVHI